MQIKSFQKIWLLCISFKEIHIYKLIAGPITALQMLNCHWSLYKFIEANFSKLMFINFSKLISPYDFLEMNSL